MKTKLIGAGAVAGVSLLVVLVVLNNREEPQAPSVSTPDLSAHPIYSKYDFSKEANVIDVGVQPLLLGTYTPGERAHSPNERYFVKDFYRGIRTAIHLFGGGE